MNFYISSLLDSEIFAGVGAETIHSQIKMLSFPFMLFEDFY